MDKIETIKKTREHINTVRVFLLSIITALSERTMGHDVSKINDPEVEVFAEYTDKLKDSEYGSDEYKQFLKEMKPALDHHYSVNRHHPEHFSNGIEGMNLIDIIEMVCDWVAASRRHDTGDPFKSVEINQKRFGYSDELATIFVNTIEAILIMENNAKQALGPAPTGTPKPLPGHNDLIARNSQQMNQRPITPPQ